MDTEPRGSIDIKYKQLMKYGQRAFGDTFQYHYIREEDRLIVILSDGLGSGIKANVLSTLTATMAMKFTAGLRDVNRCAQIIMKTLPVCSVRKISYATFTIVEIDREHNVRVINYDNPLPILVRQKSCIKLPVEYSEGIHGKRKYRLEFMHFTLEQDDRIILLSDGVTQAGMGSKKYPLGWRNEGVTLFTENKIATQGLPGARELAESIISRANEIDQYQVHDDATCGVIHLRTSQELIMVSGPPLDTTRDAELAATLANFNGKKIICGGTTAKIIARELNRELTFVNERFTSSQPPLSVIPGIDLVTEGIITLHHVQVMLARGISPDQSENTPASRIVEMMLDSDIIHFMVGTRINEAWQDHSLPDEIGLRRTIIAAIRRLLETNYEKETKLHFW